MLLGSVSAAIDAGHDEGDGDEGRGARLAERDSSEAHLASFEAVTAAPSGRPF